MSTYFTVVVNVLNGDQYLHRLFASILSQQFTDYEVVLIDNCSSDNTSSIVDSYQSRFPAFTVHRTPVTIPLYAARNIAVNLSSGKYIAFHDVDDIWSSDKLTKYHSQTIACQYDIIFGSYNVLKIRTNTQHNYSCKYRRSSIVLNHDFFQSYNIAMSSLVISRKSFFDSQFDPRYLIIGEFEFILRVFCDHNALIITDVTCTVCQNDASTSVKFPRTFSRELYSLSRGYTHHPKIHEYLISNSRYKLYQSYFLSKPSYSLALQLSLRLFFKYHHPVHASRFFLVSLFLLLRST